MNFNCNVPECISLLQELDIYNILNFDWMGIITLLSKDSSVKVNGAVFQDSLTEDEAICLLGKAAKHLAATNKEKIIVIPQEKGSYNIIAVPVRGLPKFRVFMVSISLDQPYNLRDLTIMNFITRVVYENILLNEEMFREKNYLQNILDSTEVSILTLDLSSTVTTANSATNNIFGIDSNCQGKSVYDCVSEKERDRLKKTIDYVIRNNTTFTGRGKIFETAGGAKVINTALSPLNDGQGNVIGVVIISSDITRQQILEREIEQIKQFAVLGELAAGIAHDIKNPLMSIRGCARLLQDDIEEMSNKTEFIEPIIEEVDRINDVVEHMLNFARMSEEDKYRDLSINELLNKCINFIRFQRDAKYISFEINLDNNISNIKGNPTQLQQAFINILLNSVQAINEKGKISVETGLSPDGHMVEVVVADNGMGISSTIIERIFTPFFSTKEKGTGLGLAITDSVIKKHGGRIQYRSREQEGTVCRVSLPYEGAI